MTTTVSHKPLSYTMIAVITGLTLVHIMAGAAPLLYIFFLALIIPATAYLYLRAKWFALISPILLGMVLIWNYNVIFLLCFPLFLAGFFACIAAAKTGKLFFGTAVIFLAVFLGLALPVFAATAIMDKNAGELAAEYVITRDNDTTILNMARNYLFEAETAELYTDSPGTDINIIKRDAALTVNAMSSDEVLLKYSEYVKKTVNYELPHFIFSTGAVIAMVILLTLTLLVLNYQYLLKKCSPPAYMSSTIYRMTAPRHIVMPRRFAVFVLVPYVVIYLLRFASPFLDRLFETTYYGIILVPFGLSGIGLTYYLLSRIRINAGYSTLIIAPLAYFAFLIFPAIGIVDYFLNLRFIIEHYKKQIKKRR